MFLLVATVVVFVAIILVMPKRISWLEVYSTAWFASNFGTITDLYLNVRCHLYYFFTEKADWEFLIVAVGLYPTFNAIFLNFFPRENKWQQACYILGNTVLLVAYEWLTLKIGVLTYVRWKLWYSALAYPVILLVLYWNWVVTTRLLTKVRH